MTLADDVAARLDSVVKRRRQPFKTVVNDVLRAGLQVLDAPPPERPRFRTSGFDLGPSIVGSLDNVEEVLSRVEGEDHR